MSFNATPLNTPCIEWVGGDNGIGYGRKWVDGRTVSVHRWAVAQVDGWDAIEGKVVMHICDNPACYRYDHLRIGTQADNAADRVAKGRSARGEGNGQAKLTEADVVAIRFRAGSQSQRSLAREFGVNWSTIKDVITHTTWRHVGQSGAA